MTFGARLMLGLTLCASLLGAAAGCSGGEPTAAGPGSSAASACSPCACSSATPAAVVDPSLMAFLSKARATHHEADLAEGAGDVPRAIAALERLTAGPIPGADRPSPEIREVLADTYARLAELRSGLGNFDAALADVQRGLGLAVEPTHFRGRLMEIQGLVEERHAKALSDKGDRKAADEAKDRALAAYEQAVEIQDEVIARTLTDAGAPTAPADGGRKP
jgi:tetratricopeptide (TPR) repeat protein